MYIPSLMAPPKLQSGVKIGSQKALEKNNFRLEAVLKKTLFKKGEYFDNMIYAIRREHWGAPLRPEGMLAER